MDTGNCFFVSDLHGSVDRYSKLFAAVLNDPPDILFIGGDLLPSGLAAILGAADSDEGGFIRGYLAKRFAELREVLHHKYPRVFIILGNDDGRIEEDAILEGERSGLWRYAHNKKFVIDRLDIYGYAYVPPTPFMLKDWERYDISHYVDPGCVPVEEGYRTIEQSEHDIKHSTITEDLDHLIGGDDLSNAIMLFHAPPYKTNLDRCANDGKMIDYVPLEKHIGSVAIKRLIESKQPLLTLHGHVHESASITGSWRDTIGHTHSFSAAHNGPELALIYFNFDNLSEARRDLI